MHYFCYSCQSQTDVLTLPQPTCRRCYSDFVEEIESGPLDIEGEWSDEDATLTSIWNTVFRDTLIGNDPLHEAESEDESQYGYGLGNDYTNDFVQEQYDDNETPTYQANEIAGWLPEDDYQYGYGSNSDYVAQELSADNEDSRGWLPEDELQYDYSMSNDYIIQGQFNDNQGTSSWPYEVTSWLIQGEDEQDQWQTPHTTQSDDDNSEESSSEYATDYILSSSIYSDSGNDNDSSSDSDIDSDIEYGSIDSGDYRAEDTIAVQYHSFSSEEDGSEEDGSEEDNSEEEEDGEEEEEDMSGLGNLLHQMHLQEDNAAELDPPGSANDFDYHEDLIGALSTDVPDDWNIDYNGLGFHNEDSDGHESEFDHYYRNFQEETSFVDAAYWDPVLATVGASDQVINALPRHRLRPGDSGLHKDCSICLSTFGVNRELINLPCMHGFHSACIEQWLQLNASCPVCRCPCS